MTDYNTIVGRYLAIFPKERKTLGTVLQFLSRCTTEKACIDERNFDGHITASCLFVDPVKRKILLFRHPRYDLELQPGGHILFSDVSPQEAATRKLFTETPLQPDSAQLLPRDFDPYVPFDIHSHTIPADAAKEEAEHTHHDFRYLFLSAAPEGEEDIPAYTPDQQRKEYVYRWRNFWELSQSATFARLHRKLEYYLSDESARLRFFIRLVNEYPINRRVQTIIVTHILPDAEEFLEALRRQTDLKCIIAKPKSKHAKTLSRLAKKTFPIHDRIGRSQVTRHVRSHLREGDGECVLLDIGGWFVPLLETADAALRNRICGVVEDTRNGEDKYIALAAKKRIGAPVVSVAESLLKENEDFLVGQSIVYSADAVLRDRGMLLEYLECGVIGFGKIGSSIAHHLQKRGVRPYVVEIDPIRRLRAHRTLCRIQRREWVDRNSDVIFCATGKLATRIEQVRMLRPGTLLFSVTSADDEIDVKAIKKEYSEEKTESQFVHRYIGDKNHFYLANGGNAVNFLHGAVLDEFIQLVKAGIYMSLKRLVEGGTLDHLDHPSLDGPGKQDMFAISVCDQKLIAKLWTETVLFGIKLDDKPAPIQQHRKPRRPDL